MFKHDFFFFSAATAAVYIFRRVREPFGQYYIVNGSGKLQVVLVVVNVVISNEK